jgi:hypothetical protein
VLAPISIIAIAEIRMGEGIESLTLKVKLSLQQEDRKGFSSPLVIWCIGNQTCI